MSKLKENSNLEDIYNYVVISIIGTGSFGTCYKIKHKTTNKYYVWKAVDYGSMSLQEKELLVTEVNLIGTLKHPHIVQYFGRIIHKNSGTLYIIMEWCENGDLNSMINDCKSKNTVISENFIWKVLYQTAKALEACHSLLNRITVLHRDIKPANIFLDKDFNIKLGDFGLAKILINNVNFSSTVVGTPYYMSPEQIHGFKYNKKTDVWSLGCLIYELCCLNQPFKGTDFTELKENITRNRLPRIPAIYSDCLDKMVKLLLSSNHEFRPSVEIIIHHPTVICNYNKDATPFSQVKNLHNGDGDFLYRKTGYHTKSHFNDDNIKNIINKIEKLSKKTQQLSLQTEPQAITEDVYNQKLMCRLKLLREKESILKAKEDSLKTKEHLLQTRESTLIQKQKQIEKRERQIAALRWNNIKPNTDYTRISSVYKSTNNQSKSKEENRKSICSVDLDSTTCSADPGDTSLVPTTAKLDPSKIVKPLSFKNLNNGLNIDQSEKTYIIYNENGFKDNLLQKVNRQSLSLNNCLHSRTTSKNKQRVSLKKYQNFIYKK